MGAHTIARAARGRARGSAAARDDVAIALDSIRRIVRVLRVSSRATEKELALSGAQLFVLQHLVAGPAQSVGDLAARTVTDQSSVSVVVSRLVEKGLVVRAPSKLDARRSVISLSARGRALLRRAPRPAQARLIEGLQRLEPGDLDGLAVGLERLVDAMGIGHERAALFFEDEAPKGPRPGAR